jgi:ribonuclease P protein component
MSAGPGGLGGGRGRKPRRGRLSRSGEFDRVFRQGSSHSTRYLVVYSFPREGSTEPRLGISVGRKIGGAVERNRVKRLLREAFWKFAGNLPAGNDFVLVARPDVGELARERGEEGVREALGEVLEGAGLKQQDAP